MPGLFVTATGTDVGKTYVTAGLIRAARRAGLLVDAMKPVLTGFDEASLAASDTAVLLEALGEPMTAQAVARVAPFRFTAPLAPSMATSLEGRRLDFSSVVSACRGRLRDDRLTLVEGIGGVMVPLDDTRTVVDLIEALKLPVLLVTGTALGALSHCLTAASVLRGRGLRLDALVLNESAGSTVPLDATRATLSRFLAVPIADIPRDADEAPFDRLLHLIREIGD